MFVMIKSIGFADAMSADARADLRATIDAAETLPGVTGSAVIETAPRALNGGDLMWRATFADEAGYRACIASAAWRASIAPMLDPATGVRVHSVAYRPLASGGEGIAGGGIWRMLVFACEMGASAEVIAEMENDHLLMPKYVDEMRAWSLGRVAHAEGGGPGPMSGNRNMTRSRGSPAPI